MIDVPSSFSGQEMRFESQTPGTKQNYFQTVPLYTVVLTYIDGSRA